MTALPINPTDDYFDEIWRDVPGGAADALRFAFQAGIEAERARAAAEATVEWGAQDSDGTVHMGAPATRGEAETIAADMGDPRTRVVRRAVVRGPWEVAS